MEIVKKRFGESLFANEKRDGCIITKIDHYHHSIAEQLLDSAEKLSIRPSVLLAHSSKLFFKERFLEERFLLKKKVVAGFVISCVGDDRNYSVIASLDENTLADRVARQVLKDHYSQYSSYSFTERGSDERQYCSPGVELPVV